MAITGKWEYQIVKGREVDVVAWISDMEAKFRADGGRLYEHYGSAGDNRFKLDDSVGGVFFPSTAEIHLFYCEERNLAYRAEELAHYFQYKSQGLIGKSEKEIGTVKIDANETAMLGIMHLKGFEKR